MLLCIRLSDKCEYKCVCIPCLLGLPRMVVIRDYSGIPNPQCGPPLSIHAGDVIELMFADLHSSWWQVRVTQLILVLSRHLWLYEKITCYGSPAWLGARNVSAIVLRVTSSFFPPACPAIWKSFQKYINGVTSTIYLPLAIIVSKSQITLRLFYHILCPVRWAINMTLLWGQR